MRIAGRIWQDGALRHGVLHIQDGRIERIAKSGQADLDLGDQAILPGAVDVHVHFREPGHTHKEDWATGTAAAACGGVTTVVDMPNTLPPTTTVAALEKKSQAAADKARVDYGFWAGASWYTEALPELLKTCVGVKAYLGATTGDLLVEDPAAVPAILRHAAAAGRPVVLHAEAQRVLDQLKRKERNLADHAACRPAMAEVESVYDAMRAMATVKQKPHVHVAHVASAEVLHAAEQAGFGRGVCPHHLLLCTEDLDASDLPALGKMNPPLRSRAARDALWAAFAAGRIPIVESDHAPHTLAEKQGEFHQAPAGVPGVETMVPLLLAQAVQGRVELAHVVDAVTTGPAGLLGLEDRAVLAPGRKADLAVYDLDRVTQVEPKELHSKCGWTPFAGHEAVFPTHVFLAGEAIVEDGGLVGGPAGQPL